MVEQPDICVTVVMLSDIFEQVSVVWILFAALRQVDRTGHEIGFNLRDTSSSLNTDGVIRIVQRCLQYRRKRRFEIAGNHREQRMFLGMCSKLQNIDQWHGRSLLLPALRGDLFQNPAGGCLFREKRPITLYKWLGLCGL